MSDPNASHVFLLAFQEWFWSLDENEKRRIITATVERYYPNSFDGFCRDIRSDDLKLGIQHGI